MCFHKSQSSYNTLLFPLKRRTALHHAHFVALAQATGLAAFTPVLVDGALIGGGADVVIVT